MKKLLLVLLSLPILGIDSCEGEVEERTFGPPVASGIVLNDLCYNLSPEQLAGLKLGEESVAARSMSIFSNPSSIIEEHYLSLIEITGGLDCSFGDDTIPCDEYKFYEGIFHVEENELSNFERVFYLRAKEELKAANTKTQESTIDEDVCMFTQEMYEQAGIKMTYHNFIKSEYTTKPPKAVQEKQNCGGIEDCELDMIKLEFDQVLVTDTETISKHFVYHISNEVPFLSRVMKRCITHSLPQHIDEDEDGKMDEGELKIIPVHECRDVVDFRFGT